MKNAASLEADSEFRSACRWGTDDIPDMRDNWLCYDFKRRKIVPTHCTICPNGSYGRAVSI
jgi:hypothetical protein